MISVARRIAYQVLHDVERAGAYPNVALQNALRKQPMYGDDKALCTRIVYGTLQRRLSLDALLSPVTARPLTELDGRVLTILRMTVYQLGFLDRIPSYAALNEAVELCKGALPKAAGFVNGVLRAFVRDTRSAQNKLDAALSGLESWDEAQSVRYSYPLWLVALWRESYGETRAIAMLAAGNEPASLSVRVNRLKADRAELLAQLDEQVGVGVAEASRVSPDGIRFRVGFDVEQWTAYQAGMVSVQDEAAMLVAPLLQVEPAARVLDLCAAPGTKTTHIAELQADEGSIEAIDIHAHKVRLIVTACSRLGLQSIQTRAVDARRLVGQPDFHASFDAVLLDAPCSGLGVLRHRPDIRWRRTPTDVAQLVVLQAELLDAAMMLVRPGGSLVYSTCTLVPQENEAQVQRVLGNGDGDWVVEDVADSVPNDVYQGADKTPFGLTITPERFDTDGFFMTRLRRVR